MLGALTGSAVHHLPLLDLAHRDEPVAEPGLALEALKQRFAQTSFNSLQVIDARGERLARHHSHPHEAAPEATAGI